MFSRVLDFIFPPRSDERLVRELSEASLLALLNPCVADETDVVALLPFHHEPVRALVHEAKYHGSSRAFTLLAAALAEYLRDADFFGTPHLALVPVPLGARRRAARGYNQAEEVARRAARTLDLPVFPDLLVRTRETESQVSLPRAARLKNMRDAFSASPRLRCAPQALDDAYLYIVIDDVVTTGATLSAATKALREAGAKNVLALAVAHA